jgi:heme exporter protein D
MAFRKWRQFVVVSKKATYVFESLGANPLGGAMLLQKAIFAAKKSLRCDRRVPQVAEQRTADRVSISNDCRGRQ